MAVVSFKPSGIEEPCKLGESLFVVAQRAGVKVETACVGKGTCGLCRVVVLSGEQGLSPYNQTEEKHLGNVYWLTKRRLACQAVCDGAVDIEVEVLLKD